MNTKSRIHSILNAHSLDESITGLPTFHLSDLRFDEDIDFPLPTNLRLGHLAENVVSGLFHASTNYTVLYENIQLLVDKQTIGEIDFVIKDNADRLFHMELAYKFYLYDPTISEQPINNWIGPNRNDSLIEKLDKLKRKQFPLLYHDSAKTKLDKIDLTEVSQVLCLLVSLYIPYAHKSSFSPAYQKAIQGYYQSMEEFTRLDHTDKLYYIPTKTEWCIDPSENNNWSRFVDITPAILASLKEKQAPLCWEKCGDTYSSFFVVWWLKKVLGSRY